MSVSLSLVAAAATTSFKKIKIENLPNNFGGLSAYFKAIKSQEIKNMFKTAFTAEKLKKIKLKEIK